MKRTYMVPKMNVVAAQFDTSLLSSSGNDDSWWKAPETPEGCESAWWCDTKNED